MQISIFGSGYVGQMRAAVFSEVGHQVTCVDLDPARIEGIQSDDLPFYEPGRNKLVQAGIAQTRLLLRWTLRKPCRPVIICLFVLALRRQQTEAPIYNT